MDYQKIVKDLTLNGGKQINGLTVKNVNVKVDNDTNSIRVSFTLNEEIDGYVGTTENGITTWTEGKTNVIYPSFYQLIGVLKGNKDYAFAGNHLADHPKAIELVLSHAKINVIQEQVVSGEVYTNPFSSKEKEYTFDHDTIINHVTDIELSSIGVKAIDKIASAMLGIVD